jgi:paraquat-inducible protein A
MKNEHYIACHECDLIHELPDLPEIPEGSAAKCQRCEATLYRPKKDSLNRTLALAVAGSILFVIANTFPFIGFKIGANIRETTLATGVWELYNQGMGIVATLVLITVVIVPAIHLCCLLYIIIPIQLNKVPTFLVPVFRLYLFLKPWGMMEIFMLGILVSGFKLIKMATLIPGLSLFAFFGLIVVLTSILVSIDEHLIWEKVDYS